MAGDSEQGTANPQEALQAEDLKTEILPLTSFHQMHFFHSHNKTEAKLKEETIIKPRITGFPHAAHSELCKL